MEYTNLQHIPIELYEAITTDHYNVPGEKPSDYSATKILAPIQQTELLRRYQGSGRLQQLDVLDIYNSWRGSVIHNAIEDAHKKTLKSVVEQRFYAEVFGKTLSGKIDCLTEEGTIIDWKTCQVYKIMKGDFKDFETQANIYCYLARYNGYLVKQLHVVALVQDWKKIESTYKKDYPQSPIVTIPLRLWSDEEQKEYIESRITDLIATQKLSDKEITELYPCSRYEQWSSLKDIAILKKGATRATKVFKTISEATAYFGSKDALTDETHIIKERYTNRTRCDHYCSCSSICVQKRNEAIEDGGADLSISFK